MKRGAFILLFLIILTAVAAQDEFSVRFHSFGKNATINLKDYLGESKYYVASQTLNVIVNIDQETGIATLTARQGWEGSEVVFFRTNESLKKIEGTEEVAKFLPAVPEILYLRRIREAELVRLFEGTIDPSILDLIKEIKREEIEKLTKEIRERTIMISVNDEVDLKMELGYVPMFSMDFSLGEKREVEEEITPTKKEGIKLEINSTAIIIILAIILIICLFFYKKYAKKLEVKKEEKELEYVISKDIKHLSLNKLLKLQKELEKERSSERFVRIVREFFSKYFGVGYDFEFNQLIRRVKDSDIKRSMKNEIKDFLNDMAKIVYTPSEKWTDVYGEQRIPSKDLKKFISRFKRIIRKL